MLARSFFPNQKQGTVEQKLARINQLLIRYGRQRNRHLHCKGLSAINFRKARTRTLIQLGGLIEKAGLLELFDLALDNDLQKDPECFENVAILMGSLGEIHKQLMSNEAPALKLLWRERGKAMLGQNSKR